MEANSLPPCLLHFTLSLLVLLLIPFLSLCQINHYFNAHHSLRADKAVDVWVGFFFLVCFFMFLISCFCPEAPGFKAENSLNLFLFIFSLAFKRQEAGSG